MNVPSMNTTSAIAPTSEHACETTSVPSTEARAEARPPTKSAVPNDSATSTPSSTATPHPRKIGDMIEVCS